MSGFVFSHVSHVEVGTRERDLGDDPHGPAELPILEPRYVFALHHVSAENVAPEPMYFQRRRLVAAAATPPIWHTIEASEYLAEPSRYSYRRLYAFAD